MRINISISVILWLVLGDLHVRFLGRRHCFFGRLGCGGGRVLLEPLSDLAGVAAEDGAGLADVGGEEEHRSAHRHHRHDEVGERHLRFPISRSTVGRGVVAAAGPEPPFCLSFVDRGENLGISNQSSDSWNC